MSRQLGPVRIRYRGSQITVLVSGPAEASVGVADVVFNGEQLIPGLAHRSADPDRTGILRTLEAQAKRLIDDLLAGGAPDMSPTQPGALG